MKKSNRFATSLLAVCALSAVPLAHAGDLGELGRYHQAQSLQRTLDSCKGFVNDMLEEQKLGSLDEPGKYVSFVSPLHHDKLFPGHGKFLVISKSGHQFSGEFRTSGGGVVIKDRYGEELRRYTLVAKDGQCHLNSIKQLNPNGGQGKGTYLTIRKKDCLKPANEKAEEKAVDERNAQAEKDGELSRIKIIRNSPTKNQKLRNKACSPVALKHMGITAKFALPEMEEEEYQFISEHFRKVQALDSKELEKLMKKSKKEHPHLVEPKDLDEKIKELNKEPTLEVEAPKDDSDHEGLRGANVK